MSSSAYVNSFFCETFGAIAIANHNVVMFLFGSHNFFIFLMNIRTVVNTLFYFHTFYTPRNEVVGGYTGFTMSVRLSVRL